MRLHRNGMEKAFKPVGGFTAKISAKIADYLGIVAKVLLKCYSQFPWLHFTVNAHWLVVGISFFGTLAHVHFWTVRLGNFFKFCSLLSQQLLYILPVEVLKAAEKKKKKEIKEEKKVMKPTVKEHKEHLCQKTLVSDFWTTFVTEI